MPRWGVNLKVISPVVLVLVLVTVIGCGGSSGKTSRTSTSTAVPSAAAVAQRVAASLVKVEVSGTVLQSGVRQQASLTNTGVVYSTDGLILVSLGRALDRYGNALSVKVALSDGETLPATLVGADKTTNVALLRIKKRGLSPVRLATNDTKVGEGIALVTNMASPTCAAAVVSPCDARSWGGARGLVSVKLSQSLPLYSQTAKSSPFLYAAFDAQGDLIGLTEGVDARTDDAGTVTVLWVEPASKVTAAAAKLTRS